MKLLIIILTLTSFTFAEEAQSQTSKEIIKRAMSLAGSRADSALKILDEAYSRDANPDFLYNKATILYSKRKFTMAIDELGEIIDIENSRDDYFRLLGACYDLLGNKPKAKQILGDGLEKFPKSGKLYYELGVIEVGDSKLNEALKMWSKGVYSEPIFPGNYFYLAKYSKNKIHSVIYSEFYLNLSASQRKTKEISMFLYDIYDDIFRQYNETKDIELYPKISSDDEENMKFAFEMTYKRIMLECLKDLNIKKASLESIDQFRTLFLKKWLAGDYNIHYPVAAIDYQEAVQKKGHLRSYNFLILSEGNRNELDAFIKTNKNSLQKYAKWSMTNQFKINDLNAFYPNKFSQD
jgi:hypothetical protein